MRCKHVIVFMIWRHFNFQPRLMHIQFNGTAENLSSNITAQTVDVKQNYSIFIGTESTVSQANVMYSFETFSIPKGYWHTKTAVTVLAVNFHPTSQLQPR